MKKRTKSRRSNPTILRLGKTQNWTSRYIEKNNSELNTYTFKDMEIKETTKKFFSKNGLTIKDLKVHICKDVTKILISFYKTQKVLPLINTCTENQKIQLKKVKIYEKVTPFSVINKLIKKV